MTVPEGDEMSELERLDEALGWSDQVVAALRGEWRPEDSLSMIGAVLRLQAAARAYRDLLTNGERVEWCEQHRSVVPQDWVWCETADANTRAGDCRIVSRLLVDPPKEEAENG